MKTILTTLALLVSIQVQAASRSIDFDTVRIDGKVVAEKAGRTTIDSKEKTITVSISTVCMQDIECDESEQLYQVPLQKITDTGCETITEGEDDMRPVDGPKTTVKFEDNSNNTCEIAGIVESIYKTTVDLEGVSRRTGKKIFKTIELLNTKSP